jgi:hypothetical protein
MSDPYSGRSRREADVAVCGRDQDFSGVTCVDHFTVGELADYEAWRSRRWGRRPSSTPSCSTCGSPSPELHPKISEDGRVGPNGELRLCPDPFHEKITEKNTIEDVAWLRRRLAEIDAEEVT